MRDVFDKLMDLLDRRERRHFWLLIVGVLLMGLANMAGVGSVVPFLAVLADPGTVRSNAFLATAYAYSGADSEQQFLTVLGIATVTAYVGALGLKAAVTYATMRFAVRRMHTLSQRLLQRYLGQPYPWFLGRHTAELNRNILAETSTVVTSVLMPLLNLISNTAITIFLLILLIAVDPWIALALGLLLGGAYAGIYVAVRRMQARLGAERVEVSQKRFKSVQEGMAGIKEIKVLGLERGLLNRYEPLSSRLAAIGVRAALLSDLPRHFLEGVAFGGMMAVVVTLAALRDGDLSAILPIAGVYALAGSRIAPAMQMIYQNLGSIRFGKACLDAVHADFAAAPQLPPPPPTEPMHLRSELTLDAVDYAYPEATRPALDETNLTIRARSTIGIVGGTGAGKTTLIDVVMGLLEPQAGRLLVDGRTIGSEAERRAWRRSVGYVPQQIFLMDASIAVNIAFGLSEDEIDMQAVERAARMAQLHDFVMEELPSGYASKVGDRGVRLSGGQRQRIGIARALYHDPDVLVLDEATSALDNLTERAVMEAVRSLGGRKTIIMIAHRLTTIMGCDVIHLMERGRIAESGTYNELLAHSPSFRAMAEGVAA